MRDEGRLRRIVDRVAAGELTPEEAIAALFGGTNAAPLETPYITTASAKLDVDRRVRRGLPEVVFCQHKSADQVREIFAALAGRGETVLGTRATEAHYEAVRAVLRDVAYEPVGRLLVWRPAEGRDTSPARETGNPPHREEALHGQRAHHGQRAQDEKTKAYVESEPYVKPEPYVAVVSAGSADEPVLREAVGTLEVFGHRVEVIRDCGVAGLQRILDHVDILREADVVIVVAGMDGALPSVVAGLIPAPVIAVPTSVGYGASFGGLAALLAMLNNCSGGVTVVNIDNGFGAAYSASLILRKVMRHAAT